MTTADAVLSLLEIARKTEATLLRPGASRKEIVDLCESAIKHEFTRICVHSSEVRFCKKRLEGRVKIVAIIGFPFGTALMSVKQFETEAAREDGATEFAMVTHPGRVMAGDHFFVRRDIASVMQGAGGLPVTVVLEAEVLNNDMTAFVARMARELGVAAVQTSIAYGMGMPATRDVHLIRKVVGPMMGVVAAGHIPSAYHARQLLLAGATRLSMDVTSAIAIATGQTSDISPQIEMPT